MGRIPIIIPSYEPDERLIELLEEFSRKEMGPVVLVNDGSEPRFDTTFERATDLIRRHGGTFLSHEVNRGKGAALKTAFRHVLEHQPDAPGVVTADSDGQHTPDCIARVMRQLEEHDSSLILGVRTFDGEDVPWKSRMGNRITSVVFGALTGMRVSDTQTGLRGIPRSFMSTCLELPGDRFEFEMQMLKAAKNQAPVIEVPIQTVYDSRDNHQTHFDPVADSVRIYRSLLHEPLFFALSSLASSLLDLGLFALFCGLLKGVDGYVAVSTVFARVLSASFNFSLNSRMVFRSQRKATTSAPRYIALAAVIMGLSALFSTLATSALPGVPEVLVKAVVDGVLFVLSYFVQKHLVF